MPYHRVPPARSQRVSYSVWRDLSFEEIAGARVVPTSSWSSSSDQKVGSSSHGSDFTYLLLSVPRHVPAVVSRVQGEAIELTR